MRYHDIGGKRLRALLRLDFLENRVVPAVATWDGGGANNLWSTPQNWVGDVAPQPGDDLLFGNAPVKTAVTERLSRREVPPAVALAFSEIVTTLDRVVRHCAVIAQEQRQPGRCEQRSHAPHPHHLQARAARLAAATDGGGGCRGPGRG